MSTGLDLYRTLGSESGLNWSNQDVTASLLYIQTPQWGGVFIQRGEGIGETAHVV